MVIFFCQFDTIVMFSFKSFQNVLDVDFDIIDFNGSKVGVKVVVEGKDFFRVY